MVAFGSGWHLVILGCSCDRCVGCKVLRLSAVIMVIVVISCNSCRVVGVPGVVEIWIDEIVVVVSWSGGDSGMLLNERCPCAVTNVRIDAGEEEVKVSIWPRVVVVVWLWLCLGSCRVVVMPKRERLDLGSGYCRGWICCSGCRR